MRTTIHHQQPQNAKPRVTFEKKVITESSPQFFGWVNFVKSPISLFSMHLSLLLRYCDVSQNLEHLAVRGAKSRSKVPGFFHTGQMNRRKAESFLVKWVGFSGFVLCRWFFFESVSITEFFGRQYVHPKVDMVRNSIILISIHLWATRKSKIEVNLLLTEWGREYFSLSQVGENPSLHPLVREFTTAHREVKPCSW